MYMQLSAYTVSAKHSLYRDIGGILVGPLSSLTNAQRDSDY